MKKLPVRGEPQRDLLFECNDPRTTNGEVVPPEVFKETFCQRCRNWSCVNAGWAKSTFEQRVNTQVERLLTNPQRARPDDPRFSKVRALHFLEITEALVLNSRGGDPWAGPGVHLARPESSVSSSDIVDAAVAQLGKGAITPVEPSAPVEPNPPVASGNPLPVVATPVVSAPTERRLDMNTSFPVEGVMIGGGPIPAEPTPAAPPPDPWTPQNTGKVVPRGAKIKMEG